MAFETLKVLINSALCNFGRVQLICFRNLLNQEFKFLQKPVRFRGIPGEVCFCENTLERQLLQQLEARLDGFEINVTGHTNKQPFMRELGQPETLKRL